MRSSGHGRPLTLLAQLVRTRSTRHGLARAMLMVIGRVASRAVSVGRQRPGGGGLTVTPYSNKLAPRSQGYSSRTAALLLLNSAWLRNPQLMTWLVTQLQLLPYRKTTVKLGPRSRPDSRTLRLRRKLPSRRRRRGELHSRSWTSSIASSTGSTLRCLSGPRNVQRQRRSLQRPVLGRRRRQRSWRPYGTRVCPI